MATLEQIQDYLTESENYCWKLFSKNQYQKDFIGEYLPSAENINAKESFEKLEKMAKMYDQMYPGTTFLIEPRKSANSNKSGIMASLPFSISERAQPQGIAGTVQMAPGYITLEELNRREDLMRKESELQLKNMLLEQERKRFEEEVSRRKRGLAGLQKKYTQKSEAFQNGLEMAFFNILKEAGMIGDEEETEEKPEPETQTNSNGNEKLQSLNELASIVNSATQSPEEVKKVTEIIQKIIDKQKNG